MSTGTDRTSSAGNEGASPKAAAAFAAATIYMWLECILRLWFSKGGDAYLRLWGQRAGDIAAMWLAMIVVGLAAYFVFAAVWSKRAAVGTVRAWTVLLVVSAIVAPLLGEWGQAIGI